MCPRPCPQLFITWLANYTSRFNQLPHYTQSQALPTLPFSPSTPLSSLNRSNGPPALARSDSTDSLGSAASVQTPDKKFGSLPAEFAWMDSGPFSAEKDGGEEELRDEDEGVWVGGLAKPASPRPRALRPSAISPISPWETTDPFNSPTSPISPSGTQVVAFPSSYFPQSPGRSLSLASTVRPFRERESSTTSTLRPFLRSTSVVAPLRTDADVKDDMMLECERVWATFFLEGATKELNVEESVKTNLKKALEVGGWRESQSRTHI